MNLLFLHRGAELILSCPFCNENYPLLPPDKPKTRVFVCGNCSEKLYCTFVRHRKTIQMIRMIARQLHVERLIIKYDDSPKDLIEKYFDTSDIYTFESEKYDGILLEQYILTETGNQADLFTIINSYRPGPKKRGSLFIYHEPKIMASSVYHAAYIYNMPLYLRGIRFYEDVLNKDINNKMNYLANTNINRYNEYIIMLEQLKKKHGF